MLYEVTDAWHQCTLMYSSHFVGHPAVPLLRVSSICWDALRKFGNCQRLVPKNMSCWGWHDRLHIWHLALEVRSSRTKSGCMAAVSVPWAWRFTVVIHLRSTPWREISRMTRIGCDSANCKRTNFVPPYSSKRVKINCTRAISRHGRSGIPLSPCTTATSPEKRAVFLHSSVNYRLSLGLSNPRL